MNDDEKKEEEKKGCFKYVPCAKFCCAVAISGAAFVIGSTMLIVGPISSPLIPFYSGLITGAVSFWLQPPAINENNQN